MPCPISMKKMRDMDFIKTAVEELEDEFGYNTSVIDKTAFNVNIDPASIIGAITGAAVAKHQVSKNLMKNHIENEGRQTIGGSYYKQVQNISDNLKIVFTPFSVIYIVKNGTMQITLDTIELEEMDDDMHRAYQMKDAEYFKRLILNKINSEVQLAEQMFARRLVQKQLQLQNQMGNPSTKQASELTFTDIIDNVCGIKAVFEKNANSVLGDYFMSTLDSEDIYNIEWGFDDIRPLDKYANAIKGTLSFFGLNVDKKNIRELQGKMMSPGYLNGRVKIGFLPNRVVFIVDNIMVTQLSVMDMNEEGFEAFQRNDQEYFKKLFNNEMKKKLNFQPIPQLNKLQPIVKKASADNNIYITSGIHPKIYYLDLMKGFEGEWIKYDPEVLTKEIEEKYNLENGVSDIPLNKVLVIQLINRSMEPFVNAFVFEKCVRALNDKPIDFLEKEEKNLGLAEIVFALKNMQELTPSDDIYDNFSVAVIDYIAETLVKNEYRVAYPEFIVGSELEQEFYRTLNDKIITILNREMTMGVQDQVRIKNIDRENKLILSASLKIIGMLRDAGEYNTKVVDDLTDKVCTKLGVETHIKNIIADSIKDSISVDVFLRHKEDILLEQRKVYNL